MSVSFRQVWAKLCFRKRAIKMLLSNERPIIALPEAVNVQGDASGRSKLIVQTLHVLANTPSWSSDEKRVFLSFTILSDIH